MAAHLSVLLILTGIHSVTVSEISVKAGDSLSIPCLYGSQYRNHVKYLCKGRSWSSCSIMIRTDTKDSPRKFSVSDDKIQRIFTVTIKDLMDNDTDYYWCVVEVEGGPDIRGAVLYMLVTRGTPSLYVDHQEITGFKGDNITINCHYSNPGEMSWCRMDRSCVTKSSGSIDGTRVTINASVPKVFTVTMSGLRTESSGWYWCGKANFLMPVHLTVTERTTTATTEETTTASILTATLCLTAVPPTPEHLSLSDHLKIFGIRLSVLIFVAMVTLFICFMIKRHMQTKGETSATATTKEEVRHMRKSSVERLVAESGMEGI